MTKTHEDIRSACIEFLEHWDRHGWMQTFGEWASDGEDEDAVELNYIKEGKIEEIDGLEERSVALGSIGNSKEGWDCVEGWDAHRDGSALVINWWRNSYGNRHNRDLWVIVDKNFFEDDE